MADAKELLKRIDTTKLYPPFRRKVEAAIVAAEALGWRYYATNGYRSIEEQNKLYAYGRTDMSRGKVTNSRGGYSSHQYGVGIDMCFDEDLNKAGLQPDYDKDNYEVLAEQAENVGLEPGLRYVSIIDAPHLQLPLKKHGFTWDRLMAAHKKGGIPAVWKLLDTVKW